MISLLNYINEIKELLQIGGRLIITTPNDENLDEKMVFCSNCKNIYHSMQHMRT